MGSLFDAFSTGWKQGRERARNEAYRSRDKNTIPVKLVEPSSGRIVEIQVTENDERYAKMYMSQLTAYAECLEQNGAKWKVTGNTLRIEFTDGDMAENVRQMWRRK